MNTIDAAHRTRPRFGSGRLGSRISAVVLAAVLALAAGPARADADEATRFIERAAAEFLALANPASGDVDRRTRQVAGFLERRTDLPVIARFTAGRTWRQMSDDQRRDYTAAIKDVAARFMVVRLDNADDPGYRVVRSVELPNDKGFLVSTALTGDGSSEFAVDWRLTGTDGALRIVDVIMEGVSLLVTYRSEVAAVLEAERNDIDGLIGNLRARSGN